MSEVTPTRVLLDDGPLTCADVDLVARHGALVHLAPGALERMRTSRAVVERALSDGEAHYGINTGFGSLARTRIAPGELRTLQSNLVRSHAAGVGDPLPPDVVRGTMLLLAASLCRGLSGVRAEVPGRIADLLNAGVTPKVPGVGSVGVGAVGRPHVGDPHPVAADER